MTPAHITIAVSDLSPQAARELLRAPNPSDKVRRVLEQWAEDAADARVAQRRLRDLRSGKTQPVAAEDLYQHLGI